MKEKTQQGTERFVFGLKKKDPEGKRFQVFATVYREMEHAYKVKCYEEPEHPEFHTCSLIFKNKKDADKVAKLLNEKAVAIYISR